MLALGNTTFSILPQYNPTIIVVSILFSIIPIFNYYNTIGLLQSQPVHESGRYEESWVLKLFKSP